MSVPAKFLERWSRLKRAAGEAARRKENKDNKNDAPPRTAETTATATAGKADAGTRSAAFDPATLPSIDSIGTDTDVRGFLNPGVPTELTRAALRRAWSADPAIRDFIGLVENGEDFNAPDAIPGFGSVSAQAVERLLSRMAGESSALADGSAAESTEPALAPTARDQNAPPRPEPLSQSVQDRAVEQHGAAPHNSAAGRDDERDAAQSGSANPPTPPEV